MKILLSGNILIYSSSSHKVFVLGLIGLSLHRNVMVQAEVVVFTGNGRLPLYPKSKYKHLS